MELRVQQQQPDSTVLFPVCKSCHGQRLQLKLLVTESERADSSLQQYVNLDEQPLFPDRYVTVFQKGIKISP